MPRGRTTPAAAREPAGPLAEALEPAAPLADALEPAGPLAEALEPAPPLAEALEPRASAPGPTAADLEAQAGLTEDDMMGFLVAAVDAGRLNGHNIGTFNDLVDRGIPHIVRELFRVSYTYADKRDQTEADRQRESVRIEFEFPSVEIGYPQHSTFPTGQIADLYPNRARVSGETYSAPMLLEANIRLVARYTDGREEVREAHMDPFLATHFPIMVGSNRCHTHGLTREALKELEEDPTETGGYFIADGGEWVVEMRENSRFNSPMIHQRVRPNEEVRCEIISQPGGVFENSAQLVLRLMTNGLITAEITSAKFAKMVIPFQLIFRLLGMSSDREITQQVVYGLPPPGQPYEPTPTEAFMLEVLERAFLADAGPFEAACRELDHQKLVDFLARQLSSFVTNQTAYHGDDEAVRYLNSRLLKILDGALLPHMGLGPSDRRAKLRYIGVLIHRMLLVVLGVYPATDRDSLVNKRAMGPVSLAKSFKALFNNTLVIPALAALHNEVKRTPFEELTPGRIVDAFSNSLANTGSDLRRTLEQSITSGNETITVRRRPVLNRVSASALERKNAMQTAASMRTVNAHGASKASKQTERADRMRRVHPTFVGYICVAHSADTGEKVGMSKQLAISADVCTEGEALPLKALVASHPDVLPLAALSNVEIARRGLARIYVNGEWLGCCADAPALAAHFRELRRGCRGVGPRTTIHWDPVVNEVVFWVDAGRLVRPLLIVRSNRAEFDAAARRAAAARRRGEADWERHRVPFSQAVAFTPAHARAVLRGELTLDDLVCAGVCEYVTPEEAEGCLVASSVAVLRRHAHDYTRQYTHCDVEQAVLGLAALVSPHAGHTQPARVTYETNQGRQTGGWYCLSWPFRADMNRFLQFYNEQPLVTTFAGRFVPPNGMCAVTAYMVSRGYNMEDSAIVSQAAADRGLFRGIFFRHVRRELEVGESFGTPDPAATSGMKTGVSYEKLRDGLVPVGTRVRKGDVLIGCVSKNQEHSRRGARAAKGVAGAAPREADTAPFRDCSVVYDNEEPAIVDAVWTPHGPNGRHFALVKLRYERPLNVGSKMSSREGNKNIVALMCDQASMPYLEDGTPVDIIINPHSMPTRMVNGQAIETTQSLVCAARGCLTDGTAFRQLDVEALRRTLVAAGHRYNGLSRLYNGATGEYYDAAIFVGPTYHQRLQKFVIDDSYAAPGRGPTDAVTGQPLDGKSANGGLRFGEMEYWVLTGQGSGAFMLQKTGNDADGRVGYLCRRCGGPAVCNTRRDVYECVRCGDMAEIVSVDTRRASQVFCHEMRACGVKMRASVSAPEI